MITISGKFVFTSGQDLILLKDLMRRWSSAFRYAYQRLMEGQDINTIRKTLQELFNLNSRYSYSAIVKAQAVLKSQKEKGKSPRKVIFGGKGLFEKLRKRHINGKEYQELKLRWEENRKGNLYSMGQKHCKGNLNTRIEIREDGTYLRINIGERQFIYALIKAGKRINLLHEIALSGKAYSVELKLRNGEVYTNFTIEESYPEVVIT
ncbi:MAG: IS200/IS605 family accessory protein TnpB-related protein, partial [Aquificaceae bacterium]